MAALGAYINEVLKFFEDADPTANKQYTEWIIRRFIDGGIRYLEDVDSTVAENLAIYHELKVRRKIPPELMDINKFKGDANPNSVVKFFRAVYNIYRELPEQVEKATPETLANWEDIVDDTITPIIEKHLETPVSVYNWAGFATIEAGIEQLINDQFVDAHVKHTAKLKLKAIDYITEYISSNKEVSRDWIIDTIFDLNEINQSLREGDITGTISHTIFKILPDISEVLGDNRVASDLKFKVVQRIWNAINTEINPYFSYAFGNKV
jgi:hypothetical protein